MKYKRKAIAFEFIGYETFTVGFSFMFEPEYKEDPALNPAHAHLWIELFFWSFAINFGDMQECQ